ncbi:hypothetical protein [Caballeronia grimmiae]|uniref:Uncharacterized protein n=1 Tax=Caballeronia grimmiae TaxID=1071679 RepID=A0A069P2D2_9BURK|nr:hypothetical protein [Caballeronia grimmiae]KDR34825.1 hypothetical protein BG57_04030 [Caballeronia grimmiae]GGD63095.1 hypothetical protein GCM10010985_16500 [Caballeronia grimmiae]
MSESTNTAEQDGKPLQQAFSKKPKFTREQLERYRRYECPECHETHRDEWDAERCCPRDVDEVYVCPECDESYSDMDRATQCEASHGGVMASPLAVNRCPMCAESHEDIEEAVHCCMWKRMGFAERDQLIRDIRLGQYDPATFQIR